MQFAQLNHLNLHYQVISGSPDKPVIVFINSLGTDFRIWRDVVMALVGQAGMVAYDKRGHGLSDLGQPPYRLEDHINDLEALITHLKLSSVILVGLSVGGMIAQGLSARRPDLVAGLVVCNSAHKIGDVESWNTRIATIMAKGIAAIADPVLERWFTPAFHTRFPAELSGYRNMLIRQPAEGYTGTVAAIRDTDFTALAKTITVPALCIAGDQDGATPPDLVQSLSELIPGARFEVIAGCGHIPCVEQPRILADHISVFLQQIGAQAHAGRQTH